MTDDSILGTFRIDRPTWERFKQKTRENGSNASAELTAFVLAYLDGSIASPSRRDDSQLDNLLDKKLDERLEPILTRLDELGKESGDDRSPHHNPQSYGDPSNFIGQNPDRATLRDKMPA